MNDYENSILFVLCLAAIVYLVYKVVDPWNSKSG